MQKFEGNAETQRLRELVAHHEKLAGEFYNQLVREWQAIWAEGGVKPGAKMRRTCSRWRDGPGPHVEVVEVAVIESVRLGFEGPRQNKAAPDFTYRKLRKDGTPGARVFRGYLFDNWEIEQ